MLTLRDLQSSKTHQVPPSGIVLGREGGDADITVRDKSVSKHHARLYAMDGEWWLEDLNSANGTFVDDQRISGPVPLGPGIAFTLSNYQFEVTNIGDADSGGDADFGGEKSGPRTRIGGTPLDADGDIEPTAPPPRSAGRGKMAAAMQPKQQPPQPVRPGRSAPPPPPPKRGGPKPRVEADPDFDDGGIDLSPEVAAGSPLAALPKAIAHYMITVPKLLFNPLGTIRNSIEDQKFPPMKGMELLGWALPGLAFTLGLGVAASFVVVLVTAIRGGGFLIGTLITGIVTAIIGAIIGAAVIAFLFHPIFVFIVDRVLKGQSTEKSRTNYLIISIAGTILTSIPAALTVIFTLLVGFLPGSAARVGPIIMLLPMVINVGASLIALAVSYFWFKHFEVYKWVPIVILVLMVLSAVSPLLAMVSAVRVAISGGGGSTTMVATGGGTTATMTMPAGLTAEQQAAYKKAQAAAEKAQKDAQAAIDKAQKDAGTAVKDGTETVKDGGRTVAAAATAVVGKATPMETAAPRATPEDASTRPGGTMVTNPGTPTNPGTTVASNSGTPYQRYASRRDAVEKAIADDPTLLTRDPQLLNAYRNLHTQQTAIRKQIGKGFVAPDDVVTQRLIEAETFEKTGTLVDQIHNHIFKN